MILWFRASCGHARIDKYRPFSDISLLDLPVQFNGANPCLTMQL
jgi:hypothetical protein